MRILMVLILVFAALFIFAGELTIPDKAEEVPVPSFIDLNNVDLTKAPEEHEVVKDDTLWDISEKYLKSPWYWPKVWSINPQIKNPHLIYPGDKIYFRGNGEMMMPTNEGISTDSSDAETDDFARSGKTLDGKPDNYKDYVKLGGKYRIDRFKNVEDTLLDTAKKGFISEEKLMKASEIIGSFEPKELLATEDNIYVKVGKEPYNPGDYVEIFKKEEVIKHPYTNETVGTKIEISGKGKVLDVNKNGVATVKIIKAYTGIERGYSVRKWEDYDKNIPITASSSKIMAIVLTAFDPVIFYGQGHIIYLDKGSKNGLQIGNLLTVHRRGDGIDAITKKEELKKLPLETIGEIVIVKTDENTSVGIITQSIIAMQRGDIAIVGGTD